MNADTLTKLAANGYDPFNSHVNGIDHAAIRGSKHDYIFRDGDHGAGKRTYMSNADNSLAVLTLAFSEATPFARQFSDSLIKLLAPKDSLLKKHHRPLVRFDSTSTQFVFKGAPTWMLRIEIDFGPSTRLLFQHGIRFSDASQFGTASLAVAASDVLIANGCTWGDRSPLNTLHDALPEWDRDGLSPKINDLFERLAATGNVRECEAFTAQRAPGYWDQDQVMARRRLRHVPDAPPPEPAKYADPRLERAFHNPALRLRPGGGVQ